MESALLSTGAAFMLGAMHALEPGHGKTFITAYMIGNKGSIRHVMTMGVSMALSHTFMLIIIGLSLHVLLPVGNNEQLEHIIEIAAPLIIILIGFYLLYKSRKKHKHHCCQHHSHENYPHHSEAHSHKTTAMIGLTGGLLPCPSAIAAFVLAGSSLGLQNSWGFMLLYVSGFIVIMMSIALIILMTRNKLAEYISDNRLTKNAQLISAVMVMAVGIFYLINNLNHHH